jgi:hypothetical protein
VAKKARKRLEEEAEAASFEFPVFDEQGFIAHEYEQTFATLYAVLIALALGVLSAALGGALAAAAPALEALIPILVAIAVIIASPLLLARLRDTSTYTKGDWASVILLEVFGWLGVWFLLANLVSWP